MNVMNARRSSPQQLDREWFWYYPACPCCGGELHDTEETGRTIQQVELPELPVETEQHTAQGQWCPKCEKTFIPTLPDELRKAGLAGPRLTALVGFLKGACHMSCSTLRKYFRDVIGVTISRGMLRKLVGKVSAALADPYEALCAMLPTEDRLNVDETGHKENGQRLWTWCFRAYLYTVYKSLRRVGVRCWSRCWGRNSTASWAATISVRITSICATSASCCSFAWRI